MRFYEHVHGYNNVCILYFHNIKATVTFKVTSLDDNISHMGNTSYQNPQNVLYQQVMSVTSYLFPEKKGCKSLLS